MAEARRFSIVCVSPQAWDAPLPTNRQQIMRRAAESGHEVLFVDSSSFLVRDVRSLVRHPRRELRRRLSGLQVAPRIRIRSAVNVVPWGKKYAVASRVNFALTARMLRRAVRRLPSPVVLWIYDPSASLMSGALGEAFAVYDCVDDYAEQYAPSRRRMALVAAADVRAGETSRLVFATTEALAARHRRHNPRTHLIPNAGDYEHFSKGADRSAVALDVSELPRPILGFAGNLMPDKVDFSLLHSIAAERPDWTILLIGPANGGAERDLHALTSLRNVTWLGLRPYDVLPHYVAAFDVGLAPYVASPYTRNVFPLKIYEYLAAGKPVVATGTPSLAGMEPDVVLVNGASEVIAAVEEALGETGAADRSRRIALASRNTWEIRTQRLLSLIAEELGT